MASTPQVWRTAVLAASLSLGTSSTSLSQIETPLASSPLDGPAVLQGHELRGLRASVVQQILTGERGGEIGLAALAIPLAADDTAAEVLLLVEIDGADLLASNPARTPRFELFAYVLDGSGRITAHLAQAFVLDTTTLGEAVWQSGLKFFGRMALPPGLSQVRILVRNFHSGATGLITLPLDVPLPQVGRPVLLPPLFPEPVARDSWLPVRGWRRSSEDAPWVYPFVADPMTVVDPAALPVLVAGVETQVYLFGIDLPDGKMKADFRPIDPTSDERDILVSKDTEIVSRDTSSSSELEFVLASFSPPDLEPGRYRLELSFPELPDGRLASPPIPVLLVHGDVREKDLLWCDLRHMVGRSGVAEIPRAATPVPEPGQGAPEEQNLGRAARRLGKDYRQVLASLEKGSDEATQIALFELESSALGIGKLKRLTMMRTAELAIAKDLSRDNPEVLLPILTLHADTHQLYRARRLYSLTFHARAMVEILAELYAELGGSPTTTANVMASLAGYLQESNLLASSRRLYQRGLQHDPEAPAALLGLAASFEKYGGYTEAIEILERLVVAAPELEEARLRLAINLQRVGRRPRARELLLSITETEPFTWTAAVAFEEIAQDYLEEDEARPAADLLQRAIAGSPDRQGLRLLLAHVYDRLGRPQLALEQLQQVEALSGSRPSSERFLYDSWPTTILDAARRDVATEAEAAVAALRRVINEQSAGG